MPFFLLDDFRQEGGALWKGNLARGKGAFPDGRPSASVNGSILSETLPSDWRSYGSLQLTIYNPWGRTTRAGFNLYDQAALDSPDLEYGDCVEHGGSVLLGDGVTHIVIQIAPISTKRGNRMLDCEHIRKLVLFFPEPEPGEAPLPIAGLRLSQALDTVDEAADARPGDSILHIKHLDIRCYTHQPELYAEPEDIARLKITLAAEMAALGDAIRIAEINGKQTHYSRAVMLAAEVASKSRSVLAWHFGPKAKRRNLSQALALVRAEKNKLVDYLSSRRHEDEEDDSNVSLSLVKPVPDLGRLTLSGDRFLGSDGKPVLICAMSYHNEGALLEFFAPERHKVELYAVGGGSRYDIEGSPVYEAFHKHPGTARIGWRGWCGHLIKDQWAMGGRKENVVLCLENRHILEAIEEYNRIHAADWTGLPGLAYVILAYELTYLCYCEESLRRFRLWLRERHGAIEALNEKWGTSYREFDEITPPPTEGHGPLPDVNRAAWYDWADWNMRRFTDHLKWTYNGIRELHPSMPICAGGSSSMLSANIGTTGIDEELIINEVDDVILHEGRDVMGIDLFRSLSEKPKPMVDPEQGGNCDKWFLNYLHGKSAISMFWWPRQPSRQFPGSTLVSPAHGDMSIPKVLEHLTTALDIRRLNQEITAFWDIPKEAAILYSRTSMIQVDPQIMTAQKTPFLEALRESYEAARCLDAGLTFITERQLLAGRGGDYKLLVLSAVRNLPADVFDALELYVTQGGTVVVTPESLMADEYNRPQNYLERWGIAIRDTLVPTVESMGEAKQRYDQNLDRSIRFSAGKTVTAAGLSGIMAGLKLTTSGLFQHVAPTSGEIAAAGPDGEPVLLRIPRGKGQIWYLAGAPERASFTVLLDRVFEDAGITRHIKVTDAAGNRIPGLEARLARRTFNDLVYLSNESGRTVEYSVRIDRPHHHIRELRSMASFEKAEGVIEPDQVLLFSFQKEP